jgi:hypothetical protein
MVNVMTQEPTAQYLHARAEKAFEHMIVAWDYWEDGATDNEVAVSLATFIAVVAEFIDDAARYAPLASKECLAKLTPAIEAARSASTFDDQWDACDELEAVLYETQQALGYEDVLK